jgi:hypothetical protein
MLSKIVDLIPDQPGIPPGSAVTKQQIDKLSNNMCLMLQVLDNGQYRDVNCSCSQSPTTNDTKTAYFDRSNLDALFAANPGSNGLFIYFGVHNSNIFPVRKPSYNNKLMSILVTATNGIPNLSVDNSVQIAGYPLDGGGTGGGTGMDNGKLCPPDTTC